MKNAPVSVLEDEGKEKCKVQVFLFYPTVRMKWRNLAQSASIRNDGRRVSLRRCMSNPEERTRMCPEGAITWANGQGNREKIRYKTKCSDPNINNSLFISDRENTDRISYLSLVHLCASLQNGKSRARFMCASGARAFGTISLSKSFHTFFFVAFTTLKLVYLQAIN
uniref:Uncharacterized protein n=1 Tax=Strigamia maritima TaxID=126957 RepID=T1IY10_STRMM